MPTPELSVVVVAGHLRHRARRVLDALAVQTVADRVELVVVDLLPEEAGPALGLPEGIAGTYLRPPGLTRWSDVRAASLRATRAPYVAALEDHCYPAPGWAEAVLAAHRRGSVAVGYAFTNANPGYVSGAGLIADYGRWMHPVRGGPVPILPGNNVSYAKEVLLSLDETLLDSLAVDFNVHEELRARGHELHVEAGALAAHENFSRFPPLWRANYAYSRLLGANRARTRGWGRARRLVYAAGTAPLSPLINAGRLAASLRGRRALWGPVAVSMPVVASVWVAAALGESVGYLRGAGEAERSLLRWEAEAVRATS